MPEVWYMDDSEENPSEEHHLNPPHYLTIEELASVSGVEYWRVDVENLENEKEYHELRKKRGFDYEDLVEVCKEKMPDYDENLKRYYTEHLHEDDEMRLFLNGSGYFDVRDKNDKWIRIKAMKGDLLILPAGIYHRFSVDKSNYAKVLRLFSGTTVWVAIDRPANPARTKCAEFKATNNQVPISLC